MSIRPAGLVSILGLLALSAATAGPFTEPAGDTQDTPAIQIHSIASGLNRPWGLAFLPGGDLLVTAKNGGLYRLPEGMGPVTEIRGLPEDIDGRLETVIDNSGLFDIAVDPDFESTRRVFLSYASAGEGGAALKVSSFLLFEDQLRDQRTLLLAGPRSPDRSHYGGALLPLPDGTLIVASGERHAFEKPQGLSPVAQDPRDLRGKILRIRNDGTVPEDNPFVGNKDYDPRVYAIGIRNTQGMARSSGGYVLFSEHGPRAGDEINLLQPGRNYGWPVETCGSYKDRDYQPPAKPAGDLAAPLACWSDVTYAPAGITFYQSDQIPGWKDKLLVAGLSAGYLLLLTLEDQRVTGAQSLLDGRQRRLRDVAVAPDGSVYLAMDGEDGGVLRLTAGHSAAVTAQPAQPWSPCLQCHSVSAAAGQNTMSLADVLGRPAGSAAGVAYSDALRNSGIVWNQSLLDQYLADPDGLVPGTTMPVSIEDPDERRKIVEYIISLSDT